MSSSQDGFHSIRVKTAVLDTSALLAKIYRLLPRYEIELYTSPSVVEEVRDYESKEALQEALDLGLLTVKAPGKGFVERVLKHASAIGEISKLSRTDVEVAALALELKEAGGTVVFTDDYSLQNLLLHLRIGFKPLKTLGISKERVYIEKCPVCGYVPGEPGERTCPLCGSEIKRVKSFSVRQ
ncbi:NOB1 family endonuclease [Thermosphaera sp.]